MSSMSDMLLNTCMNTNIRNQFIIGCVNVYKKFKIKMERLPTCKQESIILFYFEESTLLKSHAFSLSAFVVWRRHFRHYI